MADFNGAEGGVPFSMKDKIMFVIVPVIFALTTGCSSPSESPQTFVTPPVIEPPAAPTLTPEPPSTTGDDVGLHSPMPTESYIHSPAPFGSRVSIENSEYQIRGIIRPATKQVLDFSTDIPAPKDREEYILIEIVETCNSPPSGLDCYFRNNNMRLTSSSGIIRKPIDVPGLPYILTNRHMPGGNSISGYLAFIVNKDETDLVLYFKSETGETIFLAVE